MRVAVHLGDLPPEAAGGFTFQEDVYEALRALAPDGHSFVIASSRRPKSAERLDTARFSFATLHASSGGRLSQLGRVVALASEPFVRAAGGVSRLDRALTPLGVDMVWFVSPFWLATELPYIYTVWDLQHRRQPWWPEVSSQGRWWFREQLYNRAIKRAYKVITPNSAGRDELERFYGLTPERIRMLPHPTPGYALRESAPTAADLSGAVPGLKSPYLLYPAQFWPHKNHVGLLHALAILRDRHDMKPDLVCVGPDRGNAAFVASQARALGVESQLRLPGFVSREVLTALYRGALALVYPSYFGPENLPPLEAQALGCPVIAAAAAGVAEQLGDGALLVDPSDAAGLAEAITRLATAPGLRDSLIARGRERAGRWTARDYVAAVLGEIDAFSAARACWAR